MAILDRYPIRSALVDGDKVSTFWQYWFTNLVTYVNALLTNTQDGFGSPEGVVTAPQGTLYLRRDGGVNTTLYVKTSGGVDTPTNVGWSAK